MFTDIKDSVCYTLLYMKETSHNKQAQTEYPVHELIAERWSPRSFADQSVPVEDIQSLFEAARWSASSYNEQPWRYVVGVKGDTGSYEKIFSCLNEFNQSWAGTAPILALSFARTHFSSQGEKPNAHAWHDVGAASAQLTLQAKSLGLYVHQMAGIEYEKIADVYNLPENIVPVAALAIGYADEPEKLPNDLQAGETAPRERKNLGDIVFGEEFGSSHSLFS